MQAEIVWYQLSLSLKTITLFGTEFGVRRLNGWIVGGFEARY
jgi:hypothetical protein